MARAEAIKIHYEDINRNCTVSGSSADFCDRNGQHGDKEL